MQHVKGVTVFALFLMGLSGCRENFIDRQVQATRADQVVLNPPPNGIGGYNSNPGGQPLAHPTITRQTFIPEYGLWAHTKCHTWRIEWPVYPAGTDPNQIPTVFTLSNGALNSFDFLNGRPAATTYKTHFNLYHNAQIEMSRTMWSELTYTFESGDAMETTWFNPAYLSLKTLEHMVKERPGLFETYWVDNNQEPPVYQQGDLFLFKVMKPMNQFQYGGIRIVSMTPRIIEVYLAVPNN
ncbi:hypothetical protein [Larkinella soli]|uniref:hypothetical protein n=1 Tax=Larkinella soli TaxID=1770527 RepID=UPI000FFC2B17|nr:hypothetical protein [Larkinella soli]